MEMIQIIQMLFFFFKEEHFVKYSASVLHHSEIISCPQQCTEKEDNQSGNYTNSTHST